MTSNSKVYYSDQDPALVEKREDKTEKGKRIKSSTFDSAQQSLNEADSKGIVVTISKQRNDKAAQWRSKLGPCTVWPGLDLKPNGGRTAE